ncbi:RHS repeat-associated core domain-containing protein [Flavobacterium sp. JP2137]|uniref:RHS repeat-associated core domain-containing protein n=1 Tax=Flavobacterium sp. JP2137 TaxID=3414510 RepID=UPI003D2FA221
MQLWLSVDPLAEQTMEPYSYVGNNPINFTDPTGMSKEGKEDWVEYIGRSGNTQYIYDSSVKTKEQATAKGYTNVKNVSSEMVVGSGDDSYKLSDKATVTNVSTGADVKPGFMMKDGSYVGENSMYKATASGLQDGGDVMVYGATALSVAGGGVLGAPLATLGGLMSTVGLVMEITKDALDSKISVEKVATKAVLTVVGSKVGKLGKNYSEKLMNSSLINLLGKGIDDARDNKKGPYKK